MRHTRPIVLDVPDRRLLLTLARERIAASLEGRDLQLPPTSDALEARCGAFVTLHLRRAATRVLRGCIGQIEATGSLYETVRSMAYSAAFNDYRFPPLSAEEYPDLELEISVLSPMRRITAVDEVTPGTHGLLMRRGARSGLLLPQVASERDWDRETFLTQTCRKAGLSGTCWRDEHTEIFVFTAEVFDEASAGL